MPGERQTPLNDRTSSQGTLQKAINPQGWQSWDCPLRSRTRKWRCLPKISVPKSSHYYFKETKRVLKLELSAQEESPPELAITLGQLTLWCATGPDQNPKNSRRKLHPSPSMELSYTWPNLCVGCCVHGVYTRLKWVLASSFPLIPS